MSITTAPAEMMYTPQEVVAREIRGILAKAGIKTQGEVAQILGVARSGAAARLNGKQEFTIGELITLAGALNMSLSELLGDSIVNTKVPAPSYIEEKGKKKVAPIGFVPNGATYQILSGEECALWGSNPRPADYQTQHRAQPPRHADTYTTAPHRGFYIALLLWMCNQSQHTEKRKPCFGNRIKATLRLGNSPPEKQNQQPSHAHTGFNTSHVPTHKNLL